MKVVEVVVVDVVSPTMVTSCGRPTPTCGDDDDDDDVAATTAAMMMMIGDR